jgi:hypothetical protein
MILRSSIYSQIGGYEALQVVVNDFYPAPLSAEIATASVA